MPVTKKKGAIFAIHADTPDKVCTTSTRSTNDATTSSTSPVKRGITIKRKVLSVKQISQPRAFPSDPIKDGSDLGKPQTQQTDDLVKPSLLKPRLTVKPLAEKRHRQPSGDAPRITSTAAATTIIQTPAKKARVFDRTTNDPLNTVTPIGKLVNGEDTGSPASRTRSKTKTRPPTSTRQALVSPMTINTGTVKPRAGTSRQSAKSVFQDTSDIENVPLHVPINKQVLDKRRGRDIIDLLEMAGEDGPDENEMEQYERAYDEHIRLHRMTKEDRAAAEVEAAVAGLGKVMGKGKGRAVRGDAVLADVSEAYGASGSEPRGFREQRTCRSQL
jgi:hypothetical protein